MRALNRKLLRDLAYLRGQVVAVALVVACGVASFVTFRNVYHSLVATQAAYYERFRFADVFARVRRAPASVAEQIARIPGVAAVRTRVVHDVTLDVPGLAEPATGRMVSLPEPGDPALNALFMRAGNLPAPRAEDEVVASEAFIEANGLSIGDTLGAVLNGRWRALRIVGVALSPEYVYEIQGGGVLPDNRRFGVLWMDRAALGAAFDLRNATNDVSLTLAPGASEADVIDRLDPLLERYGGRRAHGREEQLSHRFLSNEITQNRVTSVLVPTVFLGVAAFLLHIVLTRLVSMQREQIAALKAFGYSDAAVGAHYLSLALAAVLAGAALGVAFGLWFGWEILRLYTEFYRFPVLEYAAPLSVPLVAIGIIIVAAVAGAVAAVRRAVLLPPAEAMQPEPPVRFRAGILDRMGIGRLVSPANRVVVRNLERRPLRTLLSVIGIALAVAILVVGRFFFDAVDYSMDFQYRMVQREDATVTFVEPLPATARFELERLPGVLRVEAFRAVAVRFRSGSREHQTAVTGLDPAGELRRLMNRDRTVVELPAAGLVLSTTLAELLDAGPGDVLEMEVQEPETRVLRVPVTGLVDELVGGFAYMDVQALNRLLGDGPVASGAYLSVDPLYRAALYARLKRLPAVGSVGIREVALRSFQQTLAESLTISTSILIVFACVIAFSMVYNGARIALSERGRELATLRVLGFTRAEVARILFGEQAVLTLLAMPLGLVLGYGFASLITERASSELFQIPLVVTRRTYLFASVVVLAAAVLSGLAVRRRLYRADLVAVLKSRE